MKFSENWLRSVFDPGLSSDELAQLLTMAGLEVEAREPVAPAFEGVVVARVCAVAAHPQAERLHVCEVDAGAQRARVVCGAPDVRAGMLVPFAPPGTRLPGAAIERATIRGVESSGMLCSARDLGIGEDHSGLLEVSADALPGTDLRAALDLDDAVFTLKLTPNRGDCLSIHGLARELAALSGKTLVFAPQPRAPVVLDEARRIVLEAGAACPRYCGRIVAGVDPRAKTPAWMLRRLQRGGVRPISALVDITNYVMLELGQPLHAFDLGQLAGDIHVRFARDGERLKLLDGREPALRPNHLVIADDARVLALAGVMGGEASAVDDPTTAVFLESAYFDPEAVAEASRGLEIASDAAHRFERGVDFMLADRAIERATELMLAICGGRAGPLSEGRGSLPSRPGVDLRPDRVRRVLGVDLGTDAMADILGRLGIVVERAGEALRATAPSFRFDLAIEMDLIEEIARVHGYEHIPASLPAGRAAMLPVPEQTRSIEAVKQAFARRDFFEVVTFSFVAEELEADFAEQRDPVALANPIASQMSVMRSTLLGSLVECVRFNVARKQERVRLFEAAACFGRAGSAFREVQRIAGICYGAVLPEQWGQAGRPVDFFDLKGDLEAVLGAHLPSFMPARHRAFHPGQTARVLLGGRAVGWLGTLHPRLLQKYELAAACVAFELDLDTIRARELARYRTVARFPPVRRDVALVVDHAVAAGELRSTILGCGGVRIADAWLFDVYRGKGVPEGRKSLAFRVLLQDTEKTLTDAEVDEVVARLLEVLKQKHGATLRS
ncbi:MAG: phenylalanine--tRNA ligase subunit beta [Burkholderiales bacterium]|nr:phenylalanine--tRNA ligase subunit beta [Burkholderiales bacterium]